MTDANVVAMDNNNAETKQADRPKIDWEDPSIPPGDSPPMPRWPLAAFVVAWVGWLGFLLMMALSRTHGPVV